MTDVLLSEQIDASRELVAQARRVVVLSGSGISAESGVPTFRDAHTGLWEQFSPEQLATEEAFRANPELVWSWYQWRARMVRACEPNAGHTAVGQWQRALGDDGGTLQVVTQNVDDLHERGGADVLAHVHGSLFDYRCTDCDAASDYDPGVAAAGEAGQQSDVEQMLLTPPPACEHCAAGVLRPGIVWFGEMLPAEALELAMKAAENCDLAVVVGTSGVVQPAASFPYLALGNGAPVIEVNPEYTDFSSDATVHVRGTAAEVLPRIVRPVTSPPA